MFENVSNNIHSERIDLMLYIAQQVVSAASINQVPFFILCDFGVTCDTYLTED